MRHLLKIFIISLSLFTLAIAPVSAQIRYQSPQDSEKVMEIITQASKGETYGDKITEAAKAMQGIPFGKAADNDSLGTIMIRLDSLSQREFIYLAMAAAKTAEQSLPTLREFERNIENISRRKGVDEGFTSQFLYGADWINDNIYRGNLKEMTEYLGGGGFRTKTLDYVSRHPEEFPAMKDSVTAAKIKIVEFGFRSHRIPHMKKQSIGNKAVKDLLQNGDIIIMNPPDIDFDIYDIGIVSMENGEPTLIHIPRNQGKVVLDPFPLTRLFKNEGQFFYGYRWLRPAE